MSASSHRDTRPSFLMEAFTLPARYYTDADCFQSEQEAIHCRSWLCAGRIEELPAEGSYFVRGIGEASVIVLRNREGQLAAFHNVCRHRGTLLCKEEHGRLPGQIQCSYHAWTYDLDGRLLGAPHMDKVEGFHEANYPLLGVHTAVWDGHVFINLAENPISFHEHLAGLDRKFRPWRMEELRRVERRVYEVKANWKLVIQNYSECLHCPVAHPLFNKYSHYLSGENEPPASSYLGGHMNLRDGVKTLTLDGQSDWRCFAGLDAADRRRVYYYAVLPNLLLSLHPDYMLTTILWPRAVDQTQIICEWHFHADEIAKPDFDPKGAIEFWDITNRQDWELSELAQAGISSRGYRPGPYSHREELLHAFDRWVVEQLGHRTPSAPSGPL